MILDSPSLDRLTSKRYSLGRFNCSKSGVLDFNPPLKTLENNERCDSLTTNSETSGFESIVNEFRKSFGLTDFQFTTEKTPSEDEPSDPDFNEDEEDKIYPFEEVIRILEKIEENSDTNNSNGYLHNNNDLFGVVDRYLKIAEIGLQYGLDK